MQIYETKYFILESHETPEVDRLEGGHIKISPKREMVDRTELTPQEAIDLMRFTIVAGKALVETMKELGVTIGRINYQDNGNWKPQLHVHLYGRATTAVMQKYGDPIIPGHKDEYLPLNEQDIKLLADKCREIFSTQEFSDQTWGLNNND